MVGHTGLDACPRHELNSEEIFVTRPYFTGIAGGSCSGKTTLAVELAARLGSGQTACISIDSYYLGLVSTAPEDVARYNFDEPSALDHDLLREHLSDLSGGRSINVPVYDFEHHLRTERTIAVESLPFVVLEGLFPLYWDDVRAFLGTKVFIDVSHDTCLGRRLRRDTRERGRPRDEVIQRYNEMARPMFEQYILPTRRFADLVVNGERPAAELTAAIIAHIERMGC